MAASTKDFLPPTCRVVIPSPGSRLKDVVPRRWMQHSASSLPAAIITPSTEAEIIAAVKYARANRLHVLPAGGGCAGYVVVNRSTVYLDMQNFSDVHVDTARELVTVGGGARWCDVVGSVVSKGYYTAWPHFSSTGVVGSSLSGGMNSFIGIIGYTCDQIHSARVITAEGDVLTLSLKPTGQERALFDMLRGGGIGLGIVTSLTLRLHKISSLALEEGGKIVEYMTVFPPAAFEYAAHLFAKLTPVSDARLSVSCAIMNTPPPTSSPMMLIRATFIGSLAAAEAPLAALLSDETKSQALFVLPIKTTELAGMNEGTDTRLGNANSDMDLYNAMLTEVPASTILAAARRWSRFSAESPALAAKNAVIVAATCTAGPRAADPDLETGLCHRERGFEGQVIWMGMTEEEVAAGEPFSKEMIALLREEDDAHRVPRAVFPSNMRVGTDVTQMYSPEKMEKLREVKRYWDSEGIFWNPAVDGWA